MTRRILIAALLMIAVVLGQGCEGTVKTSMNASVSDKLIAEFPISKLQRGMVCYGLTIHEGEKPQKIRVKLIEDVDHPVLSGMRIVLAEMQNDIPVVSGMSGTPIYCGKNKELLGAIGLRLGSFPLKNDIVGITPISNMRHQKESLKGRGEKTEKIGPTGSLRPIEIPLSLNGITVSADDLSALITNKSLYENAHTRISEENIDAVAKQAIKIKGVSHLAPGDYITMFLSRGAINLTMGCTVTEVTEKTFSACGHSLLGFGESKIELPAYRSSIAKTYWSAHESFKINGKILEAAGTIVYDNLFAVEGVREVKPGTMLPVTFSILIDGERFSYNFEVIRHKLYTPKLIEVGILALIQNIWPEYEIATAELETKIFLNEKNDPIELYDASLISKERMELVSSEFLDVYYSPLGMIKKVQKIFDAIQQSEWNFSMERVEFELNVRNGNRALHFDSMVVLDAKGVQTEEIHPGDTLTVVVGIQNHDSTVQLARKFEIAIPSDLAIVSPNDKENTTLQSTLIVMSGLRYKELDQQKLQKSAPHSAEEFLQLIRLNQQNPSEIFAVLVLPRGYHEVTSQESAVWLKNLDPNAWNSINRLEPPLQLYQNIAEERALYIPLGAPTENAIISFEAKKVLKFTTK